MNRTYDILDYSIVYSMPKRLTDVSSWHLHIPFAFAIMAMLKPKTFVELGTHKGDSYCAFCQASAELALDTACYAVDTWKGDEHSGFYGEEVLEELRAYHDPLYGGFSRLMKCNFDEALDYFPEASIDLLHIDGHHTYDSVRRDFESWLPKMSSRGVVLFHDSNVREREFGVWRLWNDISNRYPCFEFKFGHGLGVLAVGRQVEPEVQAFLDSGRNREAVVSRFFYHLGVKNTLDTENSRLARNAHQMEQALETLEKSLRQADERLRQHQTVIQGKDRELEEGRHRLKENIRHLEETRMLMSEKSRQLEDIYASRGWQWLTRYRVLKSLFAAAEGKR